ncbi:DUF3817 domain-containing protein [Cellulomonas chengniuliangii]|uniref:DUF3817 domain-containing protein n=1 Tax=Cellulomonas chengniuliangii TaxID=2968084 RepID=A0ABY5KZR1_9CELL|nr:DUF3817 domain-containing protein [Cellulomonas chengniuliangii]MCC2309701.1 DUF3817 domain-containing protein [Cellulomonas chengniuliangii]UUI74752.1 DUF3817 domain-containing protein [Cellulomonas chengniuliangii]
MTQGETTPTTGAGPVPADARVAKQQGALGRYRAMAWITGVTLLVFSVELLLKYLFRVNGVDADGSPNGVLGSWIGFVHGWIYVLYLAAVVDLWSKMRWRMSRLLALALAGTVPVMSFVLERRVHAEASARIEQAAGTPAR